MTYRCGVGAGIPGLEPGEPRITCDSCGAVLTINFRMGPPRWLRDGRAPPKWAIAPLDQYRNLHACPSCVELAKRPFVRDLVVNTGFGPVTVGVREGETDEEVIDDVLRIVHPELEQ